MQPIERVGVFALLFLVVMVVAVWLFDREPEDLSNEVAAHERASTAVLAGERSLKPAPQLGEKRATSRPSTAVPDWKQRKLEREQSAQREAILAQEKRALQSSKSLPVSVPKPSLTPAPKPSRQTSSEAARAQSSTSLQASKKPEVLKPKTAGIDRQVADKSTAKKTTSTPTRSSNPLGEYVVKAGDTLSEISLKQLGTSTRWRELEDLNGVKATQLKVGMKLRLPGGRTSAPAKSAPAIAGSAKPAAAASTGGPSYRVGEGDSLWLIAQSQLGNGNRWAEIAALNKSINPDKLVVGTKLVLPTGAGQPKRTTIAKNTTPARTTPKKARVR